MEISSRATNTKEELDQLLKPGHLKQFSLVQLLITGREGDSSKQVISGLLAEVTESRVHFYDCFETVVYDHTVDTRYPLYDFSIEKSRIIGLLFCDLNSKGFNISEKDSSRSRTHQIIAETKRRDKIIK